MAISSSKANIHFNNKSNVNEEVQARVQELLQGIVVDKDTLDKKLDYLNKNNIPVKRCVFYGRVSTKLREQLSSIINQASIADDFEDEYINSGFVVYEKVFEQQSATDIRKRKKFIDILERTKAGEFDFIVFKCVDRSFRNVDNLIDIMRDLKALGKGLLFYYDNLNSLDKKDRNKIIDKANNAEDYSNKLSDNVKRAKQRNIKNGRGHVPTFVFGYDKPCSMDGSELYINDVEAGHILTMYNMILDGLGLTEIVLWARNNNIKSKLGNNLNIAAIRKILRNKIYIGIIENNKETRESLRDKVVKVAPENYAITYRPDLRIISDELFYSVQDIMDARGRVRAEPQQSLFKSLITCECCGKHLRRGHKGRKTSDGKAKVYWSCPTVYNSKALLAENISCDNRSSFKTEEVIHATKLYFIEVLKNEADIRNIIYKVVKDILAKQADDKSKDYKEKIEEAKKKYEIELDLVREGFVTDKSKLKELKVELDDLKQKHNISKLSSLDNYDIEAVCDKLFTSIEELVDNGFKEDAINAIKFNSLFDNIICTKDGRLIFNLKASKKLSYIGGVFGEVNRYRPPEKDTHQLYSDGQLEWLENWGNKLVFVNIDSLFDWDEINGQMNKIRASDSVSRRAFMHCKRYRVLGTEMVDMVNIIL